MVSRSLALISQQEDSSKQLVIFYHIDFISRLLALISQQEDSSKQTVTFYHIDCVCKILSGQPIISSH